MNPIVARSGAIALAKAYADTKTAAILNSKGTASGISPLDANALIPLTYIPVLNRSMFGVRFDGVNAAGTRLGDAAGMSFAPSIGAVAGLDTFKDVDIFSALQFNINPATDAILAQEGYAGFALDGSNGDVFVRFPKAYFRRVVNPDYTVEIWISDKPASGFSVSPAHFRGGVEVAAMYAAKYKAYWDGSKLRSMNGVYPTGSMTRATARSRAAALGANYCQYDAAFHSWLEILAAVKYANLNSQAAAGDGLYSLTYDASPVVTIMGDTVNTVTLADTQAARFAVGLYVMIGASAGSTSVVSTARRITQITALGGGNTALTLDGAAFSTDVGNVVWCCGNKTGDCDAVPGTCGRGTAFIGTNAQVKAFNLESPWSERWTWEDGHNINERQSYVCAEPASYADDVFNGAYAALTYVNGSTDGYAKYLGYDLTKPWMAVCTVVGGDSAKPYGDYYYQTTGARVSRLGGRLTSGSSCGLRCRYLCDSSADAVWSIVARVLKYR